jgi:hypothetical protein
VTYCADGRFFGTIECETGEALACDGTYRVQDGAMQRTIKGRTDEIAFCIDGDTMHATFRDEDYTFKRMSTEPDGAANGSQPIRSETNRTSGAAGSRR